MHFFTLMNSRMLLVSLRSTNNITRVHLGKKVLLFYRIINSYSHLHSFSFYQKLVFPFENWKEIHTMVTHLSFSTFFYLMPDFCINIYAYLSYIFFVCFFFEKISSNRFVTFAQNLFRRPKSIKISKITYNS